MIRTEPFQSLDELVEYFSHDKIQCLICGQWRDQLNRSHLIMHSLTAREYKIKYGVPIKKGLIGNDYLKKLVTWYNPDSLQSENCKNRMSKILKGKKLKDDLRTHCSCGMELILTSRGSKICSPCLRKEAKNRYLKNKKKILTRTKKYVSENKELVSVRQRAYYLKNRERKLIKNLEYYAKNKEKLVAQKKLYNAKNKEKKAAYNKKYYEKCKLTKL